jgi:poly-gamma-glutamate synthesis protein (capsule biosynthesis protein)
MAAAPVRLFACGDVMTGRGVDQILPHPGDPQLRERYVDDARAYVRLAERASGPIPRPVSFAWPWGDALRVLDATVPDVRLINLETAVTCQADFAPGKGVHYRMSPRNLPCVAAARPDVCALGNNHVMVFGRAGLEETLDALAGAGLTAAGAGEDAARDGPAARRGLHAGLRIRDRFQRDPARLGRGHRAARGQLPAQPVRRDGRCRHRPG